MTKRKKIEDSIPKSKKKRKFDRASLLEFIVDNGVVLDLIVGKFLMGKILMKIFPLRSHNTPAQRIPAVAERCRGIHIALSDLPAQPATSPIARRPVSHEVFQLVHQ